MRGALFAHFALPCNFYCDENFSILASRTVYPATYFFQPHGGMCVAHASRLGNGDKSNVCKGQGPIADGHTPYCPAWTKPKLENGL